MAKGMLSGSTYNRDARPKKSRQGTGKHSKYSATSRNSARKRYRGHGKRGKIPVDMSDDFYHKGNEYCRYLITDYRSDQLIKK